MRQREWLKVKQTWQGQLSHKIPALRFRIIFHPELIVEFDIYKVLPTCDPMPVLQLVEGQLQDSHELAIQTQPGTRLLVIVPRVSLFTSSCEGIAMPAVRLVSSSVSFRWT